MYFNPELFRKIIEYSNETEKESVTDLESFFRKMIKLINIENPDFNERFFRGHSSLTYRLEPSNFRFYNRSLAKVIIASLSGLRVQQLS